MEGAVLSLLHQSSTTVHSALNLVS